MKKTVAIFDVDYTIINCDSMIHMFLFGLKKKPWLIFYTPIVAFKLFLYAIGVINTKKAKEALYVPLKYLSNKELEEFYKEVLINRFYEQSISRLKHHKELGHLVILVSASPEIYLNYFKNTGCVDVILGTKLKQKNGALTNMIDGDNCKGKFKVHRINGYLKINDIEIDFDNSYAYSDSKEDIPMLSLVKNRYKVNKNDGSVSEFVW